MPRKALLRKYEEKKFNNKEMFFWKGDNRYYACPVDKVYEFNSLLKFSYQMTENNSNDLSPSLAELDKRGVRLYVCDDGVTFLDIGRGWWSLGSKNEMIYSYVGDGNIIEF